MAHNAQPESTLWRRLNTQPGALALLVLVFTGLAVLYSVVIPLGEGPDEPGHAAYVFFLAREGRLPLLHANPQRHDVPGEGHQPPLAYALAALATLWLPREERLFDLPGNARFTWAGGAELNAVAHGSREFWPWRGVVLAWHLARLVSVLFGALTVVCTYLAARAAGVGSWACPTGAGQILARGSRRGSASSTHHNQNASTALLAAGLVAFNPQFLFTSALITNDALLVALSALLLWLVLRDRRWPAGAPRGDGAWPAVANTLVTGGVLGLALLTKQSAVMLVPVALLGVTARHLAQGAAEAGGEAVVGLAHDSRRAARPLRLRGWLAHCLLVIGAAALVAGWWYARNWRLYGDLFGLAVFQAAFVTQPFAPDRLDAWIGALAQLHDSFWARFGWMNVVPPDWVVGFFGVIELLALAGLVRCVARRRAPSRRVMPLLVLVALPILAFAWVVAFALTAGLVAWQGRLLFPALPTVMIILSLGVQAISLNITAASRWIVLVAAGLLATWLPLGVIRPAYPRHTLPEAVAQAWPGISVYGRFGKAGEPGAELRGWQIEGQPQPGATLRLTLLWHALGRQNRDWTVFVHIIDDQGRIVAEDNRPPRDGAFPMTQWVAGDWIADSHPIRLPAELAPGSYAVRVGLYDQQTGRRTGRYDARGKLRGDSLDLGPIAVTARQTGL